MFLGLSLPCISEFRHGFSESAVQKTIAEGRRISAELACEKPTCVEIGDCCSHLKLPFAIEIDKAYPRDFMQVGRVRVLLKRGDGSLYNPAIPSRKHALALFLFII
uniref:Uncharacterized protein n=1 Tax=Salix viminalis TaxID=40686 RepID=A0A6N2KC63_SALVM